ncbi:MAG: Mut7-C RNAse domain-containing protein [Syntrophobacterales bacterium]|jgi:uncharacterized protein with PIN domain
MESFAADRMLGKLAKWLRVLGYDVIYLRQSGNAEILSRLQEGRVLLTRDSRAGSWHKHGKVFVISANDPKEQLREVVQGLSLSRMDEAFFSRCLVCNRLLSTVSREDAREHVPEYIWQTHQQFRRCEDCGKVYWSGTHSEKMRQRLETILADYK